MHEALVEDTNAIVRPTVLFTHTNKLKIPELANVETNMTKKHQDNGATPPLSIQPYLPH